MNVWYASIRVNFAGADSRRAFAFPGVTLGLARGVAAVGIVFGAVIVGDAGTIWARADATAFSNAMRCNLVAAILATGRPGALARWTQMRDCGGAFDRRQRPTRRAVDGPTGVIRYPHSAGC